MGRLTDCAREGCDKRIDLTRVDLNEPVKEWDAGILHRISPPGFPFLGVCADCKAKTSYVLKEFDD